jgi:Outer membrane protein beta-barrel domain
MNTKFDCRIALVFFMLMLFAGAPAQAIEIAPFAGQGYGGGFKDANAASSFKIADASVSGLVIDFDLETDKQIEAFISRQNTQVVTAGTFTGNALFDLTVDYYHIGGLYVLPEGDRVRPFLSGTFGLTRMAPKRADLLTENHLSLSLGAGAKIFFTQSVGLRFDVRGIYTMLNSDTAVFCSGGCIVRINSSGFLQTAVGAALLMRF